MSQKVCVDIVSVVYYSLLVAEDQGIEPRIKGYLSYRL